MTKENLSYAFQTFDTNGDGSIDISEFKQLLPSSSSVKYVPQNKRLALAETRHSSFDNENEDDLKWKILLEEVDTNGDGKISFEEFCAAIENFIG